jgi:hypothetical protein
LYDVAGLRAHLFDELIPALLATRQPSDNPADVFRPRHSHDPAQVRRYLGYLAFQLANAWADENGNIVRDFTWWHLARNTFALTRRKRLTTKIRLTIGLSFGFAMGIMAGLGDLLVRALLDLHRFTHALTAGVFTLFVGGLIVGLTAGSWSQDSPGFVDLQIGGRVSLLMRFLRRGLIRGLVIGLAVGLATGLGAWLVAWLAGGLGSGFIYAVVGGLMVALPIGLAWGLMAWAEAPSLTGHTNTPLTSWRADRALNLVRAAPFGFVIAPAVGLAIGLLSGPAVGLGIGLWAGFTLGPALGLATGDHHAWPAYLVATYRLAWAGRLPRRLMPFLDDVHRLGLLRAVGPIYQFRHAELQDHLAGLYTGAGSANPGVPDQGLVTVGPPAFAHSSMAGGPSASARSRPSVRRTDDGGPVPVADPKL